MMIIFIEGAQLATAVFVSSCILAQLTTSRKKKAIWIPVLLLMLDSKLRQLIDAFGDGIRLSKVCHIHQGIMGREQQNGGQRSWLMSLGFDYSALNLRWFPIVLRSLAR